MSAAPYMTLYVADYLGDTMHLSTEEHGAYLLLLMAMWRAGGALENDPLKLARAARVSPKRWHLIAPSVMDYFEVEGGHITQKRLKRELEKALSISEKRKTSGKAGAEAKALKNKEAAQANAKADLQHRARVPEPEPEPIDSETSSLQVFHAEAIPSSKPKRFPWPEDFREAVWSAYPRKTEKKPGIVALEALSRSDRVSFDDLTAAIHRMASTTEAQFCPALHRWIRNERWNDMLPMPSARAGPTGSRDAPRRPTGSDRLLNAMNGMFDDDQPATSHQQPLRIGAYPTADET